MDTDATPPNESAPEPDALPAEADDRVALTGNLTIGSMAVGGVTIRSDTPLPLRMVDLAILSKMTAIQDRCAVTSRAVP